MKNTYINEELTSSYPFSESQTLPFPMSVISGMSIAYKDTLLQQGESLYVSAVSISKDVVRVAIASDVRLYGTISCTPGSEKAGLFSPEAGISDIHGFMFLGIVSEESYGSYGGQFRLHPSCVVAIPAAVVGRYSFLTVNAARLAVGRTLRLSVYGGLGFEQGDGVAVVVRTLEAPAADLAVVPSDYAYTKVDSINGITGDTLVITTENESGSVLTLDLFEKDLAGDIVPLGTGPSRETPPEDPPAGDLIIGVFGSTEEFSSCFAPQEEGD